MNDKKLNLGCGNKKIPGFAGVDFVKTKAAEIVHDLNKFPYPFPDNSVDEILMDNVLEHLDDVIKVMEEVYRICKHGAIIKIFAPYYKSSGAFTDPTHKHFFTENSFQYFDENHAYHFYAKANFKVISKKLIAHKKYKDARHFLRNLLPGKKILNNFLFNIYDEIYFKLQCVKNK
ncbi:methyltransferase domain-containing protein [Patescibacteria group bacterium]|nr:methyltransferase domain-containing protein [Candidatus Falkowbacteria bacterium]MBU3906285.1 methyltransferase domain-containing protein [Patescibacteria group bacterium]MBU4015065.1 methyltransferase domain-containing protein [Patescibacteria group bacterium]MBU4026233.1 methyltransferase domain-containing protein [Patescibacteria group bacterium]MBU4073408.1 methyltransferase domain-containing protein [Patescibacteria group bacterium]